MDFDRFNGPDGIEVRIPKDDSYRTCSHCGGDCEPEPSGSHGLGVRIMWICPKHGVNNVVDPFEDLR